jgi:hypothetical protein
MTNKSDSGESASDPSAPIKPRRPKRGAFPTPNSEIEDAKPYIPEAGEEHERPKKKPDAPTDVDREGRTVPGPRPLPPSS